MRVIPVDVRAFEAFAVTMAPEPKIANRDTGEVRKDSATGETVWEVGVVAVRGRQSSVIQVSVVGEPKGLSVGASVRPVDLEAVPWDRDGRSGVTYRAASITAGVGSEGSGSGVGARRGLGPVTGSPTAGPGSDAH